MVLIGLSWLIGYFLYAVFNVTLVHTLLIVALIFIIVGFLVGERPWERRP